MSITDLLLALLAVLLILRMMQAHAQHRALVRWIDALGDAVTDLLRSINDKTH